MSAPQEIVMLGVKEDCIHFIETFAKKPSLDYDYFIEVWKSLKFSLMFCGRPSVSEMKYFTRNIFGIIKSFAMDDYTKEERVCAIYMLYALYFIQPLKKKVRIRIEPNEWQELWFFVAGMKHECKDLGFCFYKLVTGNAFDYVYSSDLYTAEAARKRVCNAYFNMQMHTENKSVRKFAADLMNEVGLNENLWRKYESDYNSLKEKIEKFTLTDTSCFSSRNFLDPILRPVVPTTTPVIEKPKVKRSDPRRSRPLESALQKDELFELTEALEDEPSTVSMPVLDESSAVPRQKKRSSRKSEPRKIKSAET